MEGFIARKDICSFTEMRELSVRSDAKGLVQLGSHVGAIVAMGVVVWAVSGTWWLMIPAQVVMGVLITFLFTGLHETVHWTPFRTKWINDVVGTLLGFIVFESGAENICVETEIGSDADKLIGVGQVLVAGVESCM